MSDRMVNAIAFISALAVTATMALLIFLFSPEPRTCLQSHNEKRTDLVIINGMIMPITHNVAICDQWQGENE